jgi:hypothetical protein
LKATKYISDEHFTFEKPTEYSPLLLKAGQGQSPQFCFDQIQRLLVLDR